MDVKERIQLLGIRHTAPSYRQDSLRPNGEGLEGWVPGLDKLREQALHTPAAANTWDKLRKCSQDFTRRHHHGNVQILWFEHAVPLEREDREGRGQHW